MSRTWVILFATLVSGCAVEPTLAPQEVREQVERTMGAFPWMDLEVLKAGLTEDVVAFEMDLEGKPVRLGSRDEVLRYAEEMFTQLKKMGASLKPDFHSTDCRATSTLAYCTAEFDFKATMADGTQCRSRRATQSCCARAATVGRGRTGTHRSQSYQHRQRRPQLSNQFNEP